MPPKKVSAKSAAKVLKAAKKSDQDVEPNDKKVTPGQGADDGHKGKKPRVNKKGESDAGSWQKWLKDVDSNGEKKAADEDVSVVDDREEDADDDAEVADGESDERPTSRAQRYVFERHLYTLSEEIQAEWKELSKAGGPGGKQARKNAVVNACVPRSADYKTKGSLKLMTLEKVYSFV